MRPLRLIYSLFLVTFLPLQADPVISEFCASNQNGLEDEDGDRPDWVEIFNPDATAANLTNWYLTDNADNKTKWRFPAVTIPAGGYLVVFASDKNRRVAGQPLHTSFSLSAGGEYLGLIRANGVGVASQISPSYPEQFGDISYGTPSNIVTTTLVADTANCQWMVPTSAANPAATWTTAGFNAAGWNNATQGIGYDRIPTVNFLPEISVPGNTEGAMYNIQNSCYLRIPFTVPAGLSPSLLRLRVKYDDGFATWVNGQPLLSGGTQVRRNAPTPLAWNSQATQTHEDPAALAYEDFTVTESAGQLITGQNVLAFHVLNRGATSSDLLFRVKLEAESPGAGTSAPAYFAVPTPGARNPGSAGTMIPQQVTFSRASGTYTTNFNLTLGGSISGQQIRYTTDGSLPGPSSTLYSGGFQINGSALVRARIYHAATGALGFVSAANYEKLDTTLSNYKSLGPAFKSALPVMVLNNRGGGDIPNDNIARSARLQVYDRDGTGYASLAASSVPALTKNVGVKLRGSSSSGFPKKSYGIEFLDESGAESDGPLLGMPDGSDWALISCHDFDRAFMRNAWIYEISRQAGRWAPRTRLVEVYFNQDGDTLEYADYQGVYVLCETVRRGDDRIDITGLEPADITTPNVTGGYIFKVDRKDSDEFAWRTSRSLPLAGTGGDGLVIHRPKLPELPTQQSSYLVNYFQNFENTLFNEASASFSSRNYRSYIDSTSWVDHNIFCALAKNVDALRLSAYFYKDRGGVMMAGPVWDFDRSANSTDSRDNDAFSWVGTGDSTNYFTYGWWEKLFEDVEFRQLYVDRWQALRRGPLATANFQAVFDGYLAEFKTADAENPAMRDYAKWYSSPTSNNITTETVNLKNWLANRANWIDGLMAVSPTIVRPPGVVTAGQTTTITVPSGTTVYYTVDGSDPRASGGGLAPTATAYTGSAISIPSTRLIRARAYRSGSFAVPATNWSGPVEALYLVNEAYASASNLQVSAVNYHPLEPTPAESGALPGIEGGEFEWIELKNISATPVNLDGVNLVEGIPASAVTLGPFTLAAGERALIVKNPAAFTLRYGNLAAARIAGRWIGSANLSNSGEEIGLLDRAGVPIANFIYGDGSSWPGRADGAGSALEYAGSGSTLEDYENPANWNSSMAVHGSPGVNPAVASTSVVINEILANPLSPELDQIELRNNGASPVDLGGWYLSNAGEAITEDDYRQFRIPNGTVIPAGGYLVFDEADFNPNGGWNPSPGAPGEGEFSLDGHRGGSLWLVSAHPTSGKLRHFEQKEDWSPLLPGTSYGRWPDGSGALVPLATFTPSAANGAARVGPVQATEIHYHPAIGTPEFVEISNTGAAGESLAGWTLRGDVDFDFPSGFTIGPAEAIVVVAFDPSLQPTQASSFRSEYDVAAPVRLIGPWSAADTLGNTGGTVRLRRLVPPPADEPGFVGLMVEDEVNYLAQAPWPFAASGTGSSIRRTAVRKQGSDPTAWTAATPGPGGGVGGYHAWRLAGFGSSPSGEATADPDRDGLANFVEYLMGSSPSSRTSLASGIDASGLKFELNYTLRRDRDDGVLSAFQASALDSWLPAENDELISSDSITEQRRAWLPVGEKGFLRLETTEAP
ncbi:lamin tail domain-containing protein [Luteolibacter arcticus]|uniref:Lamin tail domain-containing protein n=1 Tax=Luteolibacter arcticus TaxID=1581411 RepID=A0ABT3GDS3_9BACT|nr:lamin tail domain-containing protein [Luteolibacter arcticus]MCW1921773.1 lamin tail domain-containing protein [Luteolibacter arcticus]